MMSVTSEMFPIPPLASTKGRFLEKLPWREELAVGGGVELSRVGIIGETPWERASSRRGGGGVGWSGDPCGRPWVGRVFRSQEQDAGGHKGPHPAPHLSRPYGYAASCPIQDQWLRSTWMACIIRANHWHGCLYSVQGGMLYVQFCSACGDIWHDYFYRDQSACATVRCAEPGA